MHWNKCNYSVWAVKREKGGARRNRKKEIEVEERKETSRFKEEMGEKAEMK